MAMSTATKRWLIPTGLVLGTLGGLLFASSRARAAPPIAPPPRPVPPPPRPGPAPLPPPPGVPDERPPPEQPLEQQPGQDVRANPQMLAGHWLGGWPHGHSGYPAVYGYPYGYGAYPAVYGYPYGAYGYPYGPQLEIVSGRRY